MPAASSPTAAARTWAATSPSTRRSKQVQLRIATSLIGTAQAKKNLELELAEGSRFDKVRNAAQDAWDEKLQTIEVEGATTDQLNTIYSNLYRLFLYPNNGSENTGTAKKPVITYASPVSPKVGADTPTATGSKIVSGQTYVNNGFWDTYRTVWPAYSLFAQNEAADLVNGFVQQYKDGGWISRWSSPGYANLMVGTSSDVAFADAYLKGIKGIDVAGGVRRGAEERGGPAADGERGPQGSRPRRVQRLHGQHHR